MASNASNGVKEWHITQSATRPRIARIGNNGTRHHSPREGHSLRVSRHCEQSNPTHRQRHPMDSLPANARYRTTCTHRGHAPTVARTLLKKTTSVSGENHRDKVCRCGAIAGDSKRRIAMHPNGTSSYSSGESGAGGHAIPTRTHARQLGARLHRSTAKASCRRAARRALLVRCGGNPEHQQTGCCMA